MRSAITALLAGLLFSALPGIATAQLRTSVVATGLVNPVAFVVDPMDASTFLVVEQRGTIRGVRNGVVSSTMFLDIRGQLSAGGERGLLGRAFIEQPFANHNGGHLAFAPDGYLYIGLGDGGSGGDPLNHAQNPNSLLGKMLRVDVGVDDADRRGYRVPDDNPFVDREPIAALTEIWAFGLRNPWRYSFDDWTRGGTGALVIADVGQSARDARAHPEDRALT